MEPLYHSLSCLNLPESVHTIPSINCLQLIPSWSWAINRYLESIQKQIPVMVAPLVPWHIPQYNPKDLVSVLTSTSHVASRSMDFIRVSTLPAWLQKRTWEHVSGICVQFGQRGQRDCSQGLFPLARAMSIICVHTHIWNILGAQ